MRDWVHSFAAKPDIVFADWDEFCIGTPKQGVIVDTAYIDEFVSLPAELMAARERLSTRS